MRGKDEPIKEFLRLIKDVEGIVRRTREKEPIIRFGYNKEGTRIIWVDFFVET